MDTDTYIYSYNRGKHNYFWGKNPQILFRRDRLTSFFPSPKLSKGENLNAVVRLLSYISIVLILYTKNSQYLLLPFGSLLVTYIIFYMYPNKEELEELFHSPEVNNPQCPIDNDSDIAEECILPTIDNPFMNFNYITDDYHRKPACKAFLYDDEESQAIREEVDDSFNSKLYRDTSDLYSKRNSQREFFTMPWTSWPNDQTTFAKWLYKTGPTCKELGAKCAPEWSPTSSYSVLQK